MKKTIVIISVIFLLVGMALAERPITPQVNGYWYDQNGTLVLKNTTQNVLIGENRTSTYKFEVNGTSYFNDTMIVNNRVGIGTYPDSALHIKASVSGVVGSHSAGQLIIQNPTDSVFANAVITGYESDGDGNPEQQLWYLGSLSGSNSEIIFLNRRNSKLHLGTSGTSRLTILGNGNVGIGTNTPNSKLQVVGDVNITGNLNVTGNTKVKNIIYDDSGNDFIIDAYNNDMSLHTNQTKGVLKMHDTGEIDMPYQSGCRARLGNDQLIPRSTWRILLLTIEDYDQNNDFGSMIQYRFYAPVAGVYLITYSVKTQTVSNGVQLASMIYKNGAVAGGYEENYAVGSVSLSNSGSDCLFLSANEYIELYVYHTSLGSVWFYPSVATNYMTVNKIA